MGNQIFNNYSELNDNLKKEKSLYKYKVEYFTKRGNIDNSFLLKLINNKGIKTKLKFYPSSVGILDNNTHLSFSYYNIMSWATYKNVFCFSTKNDTYYFKLKNIDPKIISSKISLICHNILNENSHSKLD